MPTAQDQLHALRLRLTQALSGQQDSSFHACGEALSGVKGQAILLRLTGSGIWPLLYREEAAQCIDGREQAIFGLAESGFTELSGPQIRNAAADLPSAVSIRELDSGLFHLKDAHYEASVCVGESDAEQLRAGHRYHDPAATHARQARARCLLHGAGGRGLQA